MDNKNEKTFADLFSSSTSNNEQKNQSLESDQDSKEQSEKKQESSNITFDNLFEKIPEPESIKDNLTSKEEKGFNTLLNNLDISQSEKIKENDSVVIAPQPFPKKSSSPEETNIPIESNPFFINEDNNEQDAKKEINQTSEKLFNTENISDSKDLEEKSMSSELNFNKTPTTLNNEKNNVQESTMNPFFSETNNLDNKKDETEEKAPPPKEKDELLTKKEKENPFFMNNSISTSSTKETNLNQTTEENITQLETKNIFLSTTENDSEKSTEESKNDSQEQPEIEIKEIKNTNSKKTSENEILPKSTSPFFQEEPKSETNPFFQNQINLIENEKPNTPNSNIDITKSKHYNVKIVKKKDPPLKFLLGVISYAVFIFLLLIGITLLIYVLDIKIRAAKGDYSSPTFNAYVVLTGSMLPEIQVYDVVVTKKVSPATLNEGDIITFASADSRFLGTIITHRIMKKNYDTKTNSYTFQTKGDNNNVADTALVPDQNIYGKVILKIPKLGYLQEFLASDGGWIIVILIPCLTVISYDIVKLVKSLKRKKYKNIKVQK